MLPRPFSVLPELDTVESLSPPTCGCSLNETERDKRENNNNKHNNNSYNNKLFLFLCFSIDWTGTLTVTIQP